METDLKKKFVILPVLSLRDVIVYPHMVIPLFVGRKASIVALEKAMESVQNAGTQKDAAMLIQAS